jgi:hypothetical protein
MTELARLTEIRCAGAARGTLVLTESRAPIECPGHERADTAIGYALA